ncbi:MAG: NlpC/P60 family protein, partial [Actinomycetota bacterium]|nr:NlpC/P60 family protein [Actinomycetota bacterium]
QEARQAAQEARQEARQQARQEARREARQEARLEARREARQEARQQARVAARQAAQEARQAAQEARQEARQQARQEARRAARQEARAQARQEAQASSIAPVAAPQLTSGGATAVTFAMAQLGERYLWGAAGPTAWDCSGLTMGAWAAAGRSLPHYSVAQYYATARVSYGELQPGDLIFWASNPSSPETIFHVALYLGDGQMVHAPNSSSVVRVDSVWYWEPPSFFGRV